MFKWLCFGWGVFVSAAALWMLNDIRLRSHESLANTEVITENVAGIVVDVNALKNLSGLSTTKEDGRLAYATSLLTFMEEELSGKGVEIDSEGLIGRRRPIEDWLANAGLESLALVMGKAKTREEVFYGLTQTFPRNKEFLLYFPGDEDVIVLGDWLKANHPGTADLFATNLP